MTTLHLTKTIEEDGKLHFRLAQAPIPDTLGDEEVLIAIEAAPINPSDIGPLFAPTYGGIGRFDGYERTIDSSSRVTASLPVPAKTFEKIKKSKKLGRSSRVGNEGAGRVVAAGKSPSAQGLVGKMVGCLRGGATFGQHVICHYSMCLPHLEGTTAEQAASSMINPLTALKMVRTMHREGHTGIVHTAAASQLGQMLVKICKADQIPLVCVVRREAQVELLRSIGAEYVVNSSSKTFRESLVDAMVATGATICFDALGGGTLGFEILKAMETAACRSGASMTGYGSSTFKKLYIYGGLNAGQPLTLRPFSGLGGFSWSVSGFLLGPSTDIDDTDKQRVAREITTTFATHYARRLTLEQMLDLDAMRQYQAQSSNGKCIVKPYDEGTTPEAKL